MIAELYANMCGTELWNRARLSRYMSNGIRPSKVDLRCKPCLGLEDLIPCIEDESPAHEAPIADGYQLPELDDAPWYDPASPESKDFAGLLVTETILSPALDRRLVQNIGHGATLTRARFQGRTLTVKGWLIGRTCCAVDYGQRWLTQALLGNYCDACDGCVFTFLTCTPSQMDESACLMVYEDDGAHVPYFRPPEETEWERGLDFVRQFHGTGLMQDPEIVSRRGGGSCGCGCAPLTEVVFTIGIGNPWQYKVEELVVEEQVLGGCGGVDDCTVTFVKDCDPVAACAEVPCDDDPLCDQQVAPPSGRLPLQQCGCLPLNAGRNCVAVPAEAEWFDQALIVEVAAGSGPLRNFVIRAWQNPLGLDCCDEANAEYFSACNACATLMVGYVPESGVLRFDSVTREVTITCNNVTRPAAKNIGTLEGLPFEWLEVGCQAVCLGIEIDCGNTADDATVTVWRAGREL